MFALSKLRLNVNCEQINETTEISIDYEDNQKNGLIGLCACSPNTYRQSQVSDFQLQFMVPFFLSLLYSPKDSLKIQLACIFMYVITQNKWKYKKC